MLINYGFCYQDNRYDSYEILLRLDIPIIETFAPQVIDLDWQAPPGQGQLIRLKKDQICEMLVAFLRFRSKSSFFGA